MKTRVCTLIFCVVFLAVTSCAVRTPSTSVEIPITDQYPLTRIYEGDGFSISTPEMEGGDRFYWKNSTDKRILSLTENAYFFGIADDYEVLLLHGCPSTQSDLEQITSSICGTEAEFLLINGRQTGMCRQSVTKKTETRYLFSEKDCVWVLYCTCPDEYAEKLAPLFAKIAESFQIDGFPRSWPT